jgi:hypothetical protein
MTLTLDRRQNRPSYAESITNASDASLRTEPPFASREYAADDLWVDRMAAVIEIEKYFEKDWSEYPSIDELCGDA